jgi:hypothetical protein
MVETLEYEGIWWLPQKETQQFRGKLTVSQGKSGRLTLITFELHSLELPENKTDLIVGHSTDGKKVTLYKCYLTNHSTKLINNGASVEEFEFISLFAFVGIHFTSVGDINFKNLSVRYTNIDNWANISGFRTRLPKKFTPNTSIAIRYRLPKRVKLTSVTDFEIVVSFSYSNFNLTPTTHAEIAQKSWINFLPKTSRKMEEYLEIIRTMQNFLSLIMTKPTFPIEIQGQNESEQEKFGEKITYPPIQIYVNQPFIDSDSTNIQDYSMLFTLRDIMKNKRIVKHWFERDEILKPTADLYFSTLYQPRMYLNNEFLNLAQALETYHRRTMKNFELPNSKHQSRIRAILRKTPEKYRGWLERKLTYSNEPSLRKRLKDICDKCPSGVLSKTGNVDAFIDLTVNTRNYWTHFDERIKAKAATDVRLVYLVSNLRLLLITCFLKEMGVTNDEIDMIIAKPFVSLD